MTSQGHLPAEFARACARGNYLQAIGLAAQLKPLSLSEALMLLPLIADHDPGKFDAAAVRWHARWLIERRGADLAASALVLSALSALRSARRGVGLRVLRDLL